MVALFHPHGKTIHDLAAGSIVTCRLKNKASIASSAPPRRPHGELEKLGTRPPPPK